MVISFAKRLPRRIDLADLPTLAASFEAQGFYVAGLTDVLAGSLRCLNITHLETIRQADATRTRI